VGDYRGWDPGSRRKDVNIEQWGHEQELWRMDLRGLDLGLVEDKIERAVREAYNNHLLTDAGSARLVLVVPSVLPHPLLSSVLTMLFNRWKYSTISLLPSPTMAALAAGVRSALVIDIGWAETIATAIYEYREIRTRRSTRSMKSLLKELAEILNDHNKDQKTKIPPLNFELAEDLMSRMVWCKHQGLKEGGSDISLDPAQVHVDSMPSSEQNDGVVEIDWATTTSSQLVTLPCSLFSKPVENVFLPPETASQLLDDQEHSLPMLIYETLFAIPPDARAMCMSRIVFVGGGSKIPGLAHRSIDEVATLVRNYGWSAVRGKKAADDREKLRDIGQGQAEKPAAGSRVPLPPGEDFIEEELQKQQAKEALPIVQGQLRQIESLGAWAGASLVASLKIKGFVEVERETFLQYGLGGAKNNIGGSVQAVPQRASFGGGLSKVGGERTSWTLAGWA
jgi:actin-related protein